MKSEYVGTLTTIELVTRKQSDKNNNMFNVAANLKHVNTHENCEEVGVVKGLHLLQGEVRTVATALKVVEEVQEEVQKVKDDCEDEEVERNGGLKVEKIRSSCDDHEMTRTSET